MAASGAGIDGVAVMTDDAEPDAGASDPFAVIRTLDDEAVADARARDDKWGATVRVCHDLARGERPDPTDCETLGLPHDSSDGAFGKVTGIPSGQSEPTRAQVRPLARVVVDQLREREE